MGFCESLARVSGSESGFVNHWLGARVVSGFNLEFSPTLESFPNASDKYFVWLAATGMLAVNIITLMPVARPFTQAVAADSVPLLKAWPASARTWNRPTGPAHPSARISWKALAIPPSTRTREQTHSLGRGQSQARTRTETAEAPHVYYLQPCARPQLCAASGCKLANLVP